MAKVVKEGDIIFTSEPVTFKPLTEVFFDVYEVPSEYVVRVREDGSWIVERRK